ncbi:MAG: nuclear transport factor 2 family protein [Myxococcaceae bacterium]|nr:nuclear transport factor 2 family protein [Myxococcaceae bacterium]MCI0672633.1 nuclear transport factor 2 family protein [Myxococcaceae bacterium]
MSLVRLAVVLSSLVALSAVAQDATTDSLQASSHLSSEGSLTLAASPTALLADPDGCPPPRFTASALEVFYARYEALITGDVRQLTCLYAPNATVILPGTVLHGRAQIVPALLQFGSVFGGAQPQLTSVTADGFVVMATFQLFGPQLSIPDGSDTFVIAFGRVLYQTVHSTVVPTAQPTAP